MSDQQLPLDYEGAFGERMSGHRAKVSALDPERLGVQPNAWKRCVELINAIWSFSRGLPEGYCQVAPDRLRASAGMKSRALSNARCTLKRLGLIDNERHYPMVGEHRKPDKLWVVVERLDELAAEHRLAKRRSLPPKKNPFSQACAQPAPNLRPTRVQPGAHKETLNLPVSPSPFGRPSTKKKQPTKALAAPDPVLVLRFCKSIGRPKSRRDLVLGWKLVAVSSVLGEAWLANVAEAVRTIGPAKPWAYAWAVANETPNLGRLLARVADPPSTWPQNLIEQRRGLNERLCVTEDDS